MESVRKRFTDRVVLVTGAARGIGLVLVEQFAREGAKVVATDVDKEELERAMGKSSAREMGVETFFQDVCDKAAWDEISKGIVERLGKLDILINNAGTSNLASIEDTTEEQWRKMMAVNLDGVLFGMQAGIEVMKSHGGVIINMASIAANVAEPRFAAYGAAKSGVAMLTKTAAVDCARKKYGIRVNSVHPGFTETKMVYDFLEALGEDGSRFARDVLKRIPMGRMAKPAEVAAPVLFLASDEASYITGTELLVDGGFTVS